MASRMPRKRHSTPIPSRRRAGGSAELRLYPGIYRPFAGTHRAGTRRGTTRARDDRAEKRLIKQYAKLLEMDGVKLNITDGAMRELAKAAIKQGTGARGLRSLMKLMLDTMYEIPDAVDISSVKIDEKVVLVSATRHSSPAEKAAAEPQPCPTTSSPATWSPTGSTHSPLRYPRFFDLVQGRRDVISLAWASRTSSPRGTFGRRRSTRQGG